MTNTHYCGSVKIETTTVVQKERMPVQVKLYDSELKIMGVLWREGDVTAKHIEDGGR